MSDDIVCPSSTILVCGESCPIPDPKLIPEKKSHLEITLKKKTPHYCDYVPFEELVAADVPACI